MRRTALFAASLAAFTLIGAAAEAQQYRNAPLRLQVRPRSWLELGNTTAPYSAVNPASAYGQTVSALSGPFPDARDRFGGYLLPDPVTNGPFVGTRNLLGPVDWWYE